MGWYSLATNRNMQQHFLVSNTGSIVQCTHATAEGSRTGITYIVVYTTQTSKSVISGYRTAGNIGGDLNLAVWRSGKRPPNLNLFRVRAYYMCARWAYCQI